MGAFIGVIISILICYILFDKITFFQTFAYGLIQAFFFTFYILKINRDKIMKDNIITRFLFNYPLILSSIVIIINFIVFGLFIDMI